MHVGDSVLQNFQSAEGEYAGCLLSGNLRLSLGQDPCNLADSIAKPVRLLKQTKHKEGCCYHKPLQTHINPVKTTITILNATHVYT